MAFNEELDSNPALINEDAYANWIFKIKPNNPSDYDGLLSAADYEAQA